jgi:hypothetical protein
MPGEENPTNPIIVRALPFPLALLTHAAPTVCLLRQIPPLPSSLVQSGALRIRASLPHARRRAPEQLFRKVHAHPAGLGAICVLCG